MTSRRFRRWSGVMGMLLLIAAPLRAQSGTSAIAGLVKDASGAAVPGATVKVSNEDTAVAVDTVSNGEGQYRVNALVPGRYRVEVTLDGFRPVVHGSLTLAVEQTLTIDV